MTAFDQYFAQVTGRVAGRDLRNDIRKYRLIAESEDPETIANLLDIELSKSAGELDRIAVGLMVKKLERLPKTVREQIRKNFDGTVSVEFTPEELQVVEKALLEFQKR